MLSQMNLILVPVVWLCVFILISVNGRSIVTEMYPYPVATTSSAITEYPLSRYERGLEDYDEKQAREMTDHMDHMDSDSDKAIKNDPWQGYYDFLINEGSFKFWAVFQVVTAAILIYSAFAAVYYAKYNFVQADYDYADYFIGRSDSGIPNDNEFTSQTFQRIIDAISSKKYS